MSVITTFRNAHVNRSLKNRRMVLRILPFFFLIFPAILTYSCQTNDIKEVELVQSDTRERIDIFIDDVLFTSYNYSRNFEKPFLYPVKASGGYEITRGFPIATRKGERVDHPHQVGLWFNHGNVNGLDFWNNSSAIPADRKDGYGHIVVSEVVNAESGEEGILEVIAHWKDNDENIILEERTKYIISATAHTRTIDHLTTLTAVNGEVTISDNKEGLFAIRVDRAFEMPSEEPLVFSDERGNPEKVPVVDNTGVTGMYVSGNGLKGDAVWGTRNDWVLLSGTKENTLVTMGIFDHPDNPGYPAYAHARGYGLFSFNNLGQKSYDPQQEAVNYTLSAGESMSLKHRFFVKTGDEVTPEEAYSVFRDFSELY